MPYRIIRHFIIILGVFFCSQHAFAQSTDQNFPVTAQAFIVPQANQKLANYFSSSQALTVNLLLKDLTKSSIQVYLRWSMDGPGVRVSSMDGYVPPSFITLQKGMIERLSGLSLQNDYFRNGLIEKQGLGGSPLRTNLPEGFYTFRVQALEAGTGREVSNIGETYFSITTPLPPIINIPFNGAELTISEPQRVNIQWMPRHYKQAGNITTYDLKVCKVPDGYEPTEALDACVNPVIDDKANPGTFYPGNTGIGNSIIGAFEPGARYSARVTIHEFDTNGDEVVFANEGRSEVNWFRYGASCVSPQTFTIKETGPGRLQLNWDAQADPKDYKILYRKAGESNWTTQTVSGTTITIPSLSQGRYEFAVQASCTEIMPLNLQAFELKDDDDELPPILQNPLLTQVSVNGKGEPVTVDSLGKILDKIKIPCASQISTYESCEADLSVVNPTGVATPGTKPLTTLSAGDVLSIYDMTVMVTSIDGGSAFRGKGLARLPFAENTMVSVEFSGVKAWMGQSDGSEEGAQGGCVYQIEGYFRTNKLTDQQLAAEQSQLITALNIKTDSTGFNGTLADALKAYDASVAGSDVSKYTAAILQGSGAISAALDEIVDEYSDPRLTAIKTQLDSLVKVLTVNDSLIRAGGKVTKIDSLAKTYEGLFKKLEELKNESQPDPNNPLYALSNVQVSNIADQSARISWVPSGNFTKYVIEYQDPNGGVLQETVTGPQINLQRLQPGLQYKYRILAYNGNQVVASYGQDVFSTIRKSVPVPENLAFTRIDDNSVTVTWDKNAEHKTYKLVYTDERGEVHYLYPTTNSATLTGLDPSKFYDYEIVAYNQQSLVSDPANARVSTEVPCTLGVSVSNHQSNPSLEEDQHVLLVTGCFTPDFKVVDGYPKVTWTNGTPGTVDPNGTITFADGEVAEISTGNFPFLAPDRALIVNPTASKTYTAICKMSATAQPCTYPVNVKVSSADCKGDFKISASIDGQTYQTEEITAQPNAYLNLRATGCAGQIIWSNALGNQANLKLLVDGNLIVAAQCKEENKTCFSNSISVTGKVEPNSLNIRFVRGKYYGTGEPIEAEVLIKDNFYDLASLPKYWTIDLQANNCSGQVIWASSNDENFKVDNKHMRFGIEIPLPITTTTYYATCLDKNGVSTPYPRKITLVNNSNQCVRILGPESVPKGSILKLTADGCLGEIKWSRDGEVTFATGTTIYDQPIPKDNGSSIIVYNFNTTYRVDWDYPICSGTKVVNVFEPTCSINVDQNKLSAKPGDEITLKATGCGTIIWSLKGNSLAVASELKIAPSETIKIIASCRGTQCWKEIEIKVPTILPPKIICETLEPHALPSQIYRGESNTINLTATGCEGGTTIWNGPGLPKDSKGQGQSHLVIAQRVTDNAKYTVKCKKDVVGDSEAEIEVKSVLRLDLTATPVSVKKGQKTTLTAIGCSGGTISWVGYNRTCQSPCSLENQIINEPAEFKAICTSGTETVTKTVTVVLKTDLSGPSGNDYNETFSSACSSFSAYVSPEDTRVTAYPYPSKTKLKLGTSGCPTNGKVTWETWDHVAISGNTHAPSETTTYVASCTVGGSTCATSYRTIDIEKTFNCENFYVEKEDQGYRRFKFTAKGCPVLGQLTNTWYLKDGSTKVNQDYYPLASTPPTIAAYEVRCVPDQLKPNTACYFTYEFSDNNEQVTVYGRTKYSPSTPSNGRISATSETTETEAVIPCQQNFPMQQLMASYFTTLSCTFLESYTGTDGQLSAAEAQEFLNKLKQAIAAEPELQKYNLDFSKVSSSALVEAFEKGKCEAVGSALGQTAQGNASTDTYNNDVRPTFTNLAKVFGGKSIVCKSPLASTSTIIFGAPPIDENSVYALWTSKSTRYTYRLKKGFEITKGINIFTIHSVPNGVSDKWKGAYVAYFDNEAPNNFIGFYKEEPNGNCTSSYRRLLFGDCADLCEEGFLPNEYYELAGPISLTATATDATCAADDGVINLKATGGIAPYQYSMDGTIFQESSSFTKLEAGNYTLTVKDSKNATATTMAIVKEPEVFIAAPSLFLPTLRVGTTDPSAKMATEGFIDVSYDETTRKTTFKLKAGFDLKATSSGVWKLTVTSSDLEDKKLEGTYQAYYNDCDHNAFIGFYRIDPAITACSPDKWKEKGTVKMLCKEGWLPEAAYAEIVKNIMIFANGYRFYKKGAAGIIINSPKEYAFTNNNVTNDAIDNYWGIEDLEDQNQTDMDLKFVDRRKPDVVYYIDGHHSITTSNHNVDNDVARAMKEKFIPGMVGSMLAKFPSTDPVWTSVLPLISIYSEPLLGTFLQCYQNEKCVTLSTTSNPAGFDTRVQNGKLVYEGLIGKLLHVKKPGNAKVTYHIDVVAHSMGFAYAQGLIETLKTSQNSGNLNVKWGGYYILAPENANAGTVNPTDWEQVWQYGSNLGQSDPDPIWDQDGIAPQFGVKGLENTAANYGRVFIPNAYLNQRVIPKGYIESHKISYYGWIFEILPNRPNGLSNGYVNPK